MKKVITTLDEMKEYTTDFYISEYLDTLYGFTLISGYEFIALYEDEDCEKSLTVFCKKSKSNFSFYVSFSYSDDSKPCRIIPMRTFDCGVKLNLDWNTTDDFINSIYQAIGRYFDSITA